MKDNKVVKAVEEMKQAGVKILRDEEKLIVLCTKKGRSMYQKMISLEQK